MANWTAEAAREVLDYMTAVDPGDRMQIQLYTSPSTTDTETVSAYVSGGVVSGPCDPDDDRVLAWLLPGSVEFTFTVIDGATSPLESLLRSDLFAEASLPAVLTRPSRARCREKPDLLGVCISPQPWARRERERTSLELAIERWERDNSPPASCVITSYHTYEVMEPDETTSADSLDCSSSSGGRWTDLMAKIDDLIGEETGIQNPNA